MTNIAQSTPTFFDKIEIMKRLSTLLQEDVQALNEAGFESVNGAQQRVKEETRVRTTFVEHISVPNDAGDRLCKKYGFTGKTELAKIVKGLDDYVNQHTNLSDIQKHYVLMVVFAGIFYGTYEFLNDLSRKQDFTDTEKSQLKHLNTCVDWLNKNMFFVLGDFISRNQNGEALTFFKNNIVFWLNKDSFDGLGGKLKCVYKTKSWYEDRCLSEDSAEESGSFFNYFMPAWYGIASGPNDNNHLEHYFSMENKDIARFICATKRMGKEYAFAITINLYKKMVCDYIDSKIAFSNKTIDIYLPKVTEVGNRVVQHYDTLVAPNHAAIQEMLGHRK